MRVVCKLDISESDDYLLSISIFEITFVSATVLLPVIEHLDRRMSVCRLYHLGKAHGVREVMGIAIGNKTLYDYEGHVHPKQLWYFKALLRYTSGVKVARLIFHRCRDACICYLQSHLLVLPLTCISSRLLWGTLWCMITLWVGQESGPVECKHDCHEEPPI